MSLRLDSSSTYFCLFFSFPFLLHFTLFVWIHVMCLVALCQRLSMTETIGENGCFGHANNEKAFLLFLSSLISIDLCDRKPCFLCICHFHSHNNASNKISRLEHRDWNERIKRYLLLKSINFRVDPSRLIGLFTPSPFSSIAVTPFIVVCLIDVNVQLSAGVALIMLISNFGFASSTSLLFLCSLLHFVPVWFCTRFDVMLDGVSRISIRSEIVCYVSSPAE